MPTVPNLLECANVKQGILEAEQCVVSKNINLKIDDI